MICGFLEHDILFIRKEKQKINNEMILNKRVESMKTQSIYIDSVKE